MTKESKQLLLNLLSSAYVDTKISLEDAKIAETYNGQTNEVGEITKRIKLIEETYRELEYYDTLEN